MPLPSRPPGRWPARLPSGLSLRLHTAAVGTSRAAAAAGAGKKGEGELAPAGGRGAAAGARAGTLTRLRVKFPHAGARRRGVLSHASSRRPRASLARLPLTVRAASVAPGGAGTHSCRRRRGRTDAWARRAPCPPPRPRASPNAHWPAAAHQRRGGHRGAGRGGACRGAGPKRAWSVGGDRGAALVGKGFGCAVPQAPCADLGARVRSRRRLWMPGGRAALPSLVALNLLSSLRFLRAATVGFDGLSLQVGKLRSRLATSAALVHMSTALPSQTPRAQFSAESAPCF